MPPLPFKRESGHKSGNWPPVLHLLHPGIERIYGCIHQGLHDEVPLLKILHGLQIRPKEFPELLKGNPHLSPLDRLSLQMKDAEEKGKRGTYPQVLEDELERPHERQRVWMELGRRQLKSLENPDLEIIERQAHSRLLESKLVHGEPFSRIRRAYPSVPMRNLKHPVGRSPFYVFL